MRPSQPDSRELCSVPFNIHVLKGSKGQDGSYEDVTATAGDDLAKVLGRAKRIMGAAWVAKTKKEFLEKAAATEVFQEEEDEEAAADAPCCPQCSEGSRQCFSVCPMYLNHTPLQHTAETTTS